MHEAVKRFFRTTSYVWLLIIRSFVFVLHVESRLKSFFENRTILKRIIMFFPRLTDSIDNEMNLG